jgi:hypothetical protein
MKSKAFALVIVLAALSAACAGPGPGVTGNDVGGIIPWSLATQQIAQDIGGAHCARYGKYVRITSVDAQYGGYIGFACIFPRPPQLERDNLIVLRSRG